MTERILIAEDSATQREKLRMILEAEGFEVTAAVDGLEGLKAANDSNFDLVISDIMMPGLTGYELCRKLKFEGAQRERPVILLTTLSDPMDVIQGLECGADNFITKPYEADMLVQRVRNVLENSRLRAEGKLENSTEIYFLGKKFTIASERRQILNLLISTFEDTVRTNHLLLESQHELLNANVKIEGYAKLLEGKVHLSEEKYRLLLEHATDAILVLGPQGKVLEANWQAGRMFGLVRSQVEDADFFSLLPKAQNDWAKEGFRRLVEEKEAYVQEYNLSDSPDGIYVECSISLVDLRGDLAVAIFRDMTGRKKAEQNLQRHAEELERSNRELRDLALEASQQLHAPLRKIQTFAYMLANDSKSNLNETIRENLNGVEKLVEGMQALIANITDVSNAVGARVEASALPLIENGGEEAVPFLKKVEKI